MGHRAVRLCVPAGRGAHCALSPFDIPALETLTLSVDIFFFCISLYLIYKKDDKMTNDVICSKVRKGIDTACNTMTLKLFR